MKFDTLILGGGFAGVYCAKRLARELGPQKARGIGLIAEQNVMVFQPMLAEVAGAALSPLDVVNPIREFCRDVNVLMGKVVSIDIVKKNVVLDAGMYTPNTTVEFDHLVLALGGVVDLSRVPGMPEHAFILKNVGDALGIREAVIRRLEEANLVESLETKKRLLTFVVVGGGYSGVETAGQILDLLADVKSLYRNISDTSSRVVLIHSGEHLLPDIGPELGHYAERKLKKRGLEIMLNARVTAITSCAVFLQGGVMIDSNMVVSTVGNAPHPLLVKFCAENRVENVKGRIVTEPTMQVKGFPNLWAIGDCAAVPMDGQPTCPPTAQFALRQGEQLGANLARLRNGEPLKPFYFKNLGQLASIGHHTAVADVLGIKFSGFPAWWFWRTVYLWKLPGMQRKLRVMADWTMELMFRRDVSHIGVGPSQVVPTIHLEPGDTLFRAGEPALSFYIIKLGRIELLEGAKVVETLQQGEHFGEWALLNDSHWRYTARAATATTLIAVSRETFRTFTSASTAFRSLMVETSRRFAPVEPKEIQSTGGNSEGSD